MQTKHLVYTRKQAAELAQVSAPTIDRWAHITGFPVIKINGITRIHARGFEQWLEQNAGIELSEPSQVE